MPPDLVEAQARANSACEKVWREARRQSDFAMVRPHLEEVVRLMREAAAALAPALGLDPYDALMDGYQRGMRAADVGPVFADYESVPARRAAAGGGAPGAQPAPMRPTGPVSRSRCRRRCAAACRSASAWTSPMRGWTARRIRSPAARRPTCASPRATIETDFTQAVLARGARDRPRAVRARPARAPGRASRWARPPAWRRTRASR